MTDKPTSADIPDCRRIGIIIERRESANPWADAMWNATEVLPGVTDHEPGRVVGEGDGWTRSFAGHLDLELHKRETEAYMVNLAQPTSAVYIVLRPSETDMAMDFEPFLATVNPYEAEDYTESGDLVVCAIPLPETLQAWIGRFVETFHVEQPFVKRKQKSKDTGATGRISDPVTRAKPRESHGG